MGAIASIPAGSTVTCTSTSTVTAPIGNGYALDYWVDANAAPAQHITAQASAPISVVADLNAPPTATAGQVAVSLTPAEQAVLINPTSRGAGASLVLTITNLTDITLMTPLMGSYASTTGSPALTSSVRVAGLEYGPPSHFSQYWKPIQLARARPAPSTSPPPGASTSPRPASRPTA